MALKSGVVPKKSNFQVFQRFHNKAVKPIIDALCYCRNRDIHRDLQTDTTKIGSNLEQRLLHHVNVQAIQFLDNTNPVRRLKTLWIFYCFFVRLIIYYVTFLDGIHAPRVNFKFTLLQRLAM